MSKEKSKDSVETMDETLQAETVNATNMQDAEEIMAEEVCKEETETDEMAALQTAYEELNKAHLYLKADFENYRKRTLQEKANLIKTGGEAALTALLPVVDDFERALKTMKETEGSSAAEEGVELIYSKFIAYLASQGVKPIDAVGQVFDTEFFDAITMIPAPSEELKGKVVDCVQTGYTLYDKVIRHSKVVVGE